MDWQGVPDNCNQLARHASDNAVVTMYELETYRVEKIHIRHTANSQV